MDMNLSKLWQIVKDREAWRAAAYGVTKSWTHLVTEQQQNQEKVFEHIHLVINFQNYLSAITKYYRMGSL